MKSTTSATLDRLRLIVECADLTPADLRHRRDNGASWAEIASTVSTRAGRTFTAWDAERVTEAVSA